MINLPSVPLGYQQIAAFSTLQTLTVPAGATAAVIRCETNSLRWRDDGTAPTASVGQLMLASDPPYVYAGPVGSLQFIPVTGSATLNISYYR